MYESINNLLEFFTVFLTASISLSLAKGVIFNVMDVEKAEIAEIVLWEDKPTLEAALMYPGRYVVSTITTKDNEPIVSASTDRLHNIQCMNQSIIYLNFLQFF